MGGCPVTDPIPPGVEALYRRFENTLGDLATQTARFADQDFTSSVQPVTADEWFLREMANDPAASPELIATADAVDAGQISWADVMAGRVKQPPEIRALIDSGLPSVFREAATTALPCNRAEQEWDDEDEPRRKSWLSNEW